MCFGVVIPFFSVPSAEHGKMTENAGLAVIHANYQLPTRADKAGGESSR